MPCGGATAEGGPARTSVDNTSRRLAPESRRAARLERGIAEGVVRTVDPAHRLLVFELLHAARTCVAAGQNGDVTAYDTPSTPPTSGKPEYPRWLWVVGFGFVVVIAVAIAALVMLGEDSDNDAGDAAIERYVPTEGDSILQQEPVGIDLAPGYDGTLALNGTPIPDDQLTKTPALSLVLFTPGPDKEVDQYLEGQNCVLATFWLSEDGPGQATSRSFCFTVL